jgi:class 3 adenylate cyclase
MVAQSIADERPDLAAHVAPDGTVTILFSDIVGSTAINEQIGDAKWMDILREHDEIVRRLLSLHRGYEVKTVGDAFMIAFQSGRDALNCAISIQRAFANRNKAVEPYIRLRMGLHAGELVRRADDFFGRHVNLAARIASSAQADEILISSLLHDLVNPSGEFTFVSQRSRTLKGFKGRHKLYLVSWANDT